MRKRRKLTLNTEKEMNNSNKYQTKILICIKMMNLKLKKQKSERKNNRFKKILICLKLKLFKIFNNCCKKFMLIKKKLKVSLYLICKKFYR